MGLQIESQLTWLQLNLSVHMKPHKQILLNSDNIYCIFNLRNYWTNSGAVKSKLDKDNRSFELNIKPKLISSHKRVHMTIYILRINLKVFGCVPMTAKTN